MDLFLTKLERFLTKPAPAAACGEEAICLCHYEFPGSSIDMCLVINSCNHSPSVFVSLMCDNDSEERTARVFVCVFVG